MIHSDGIQDIKGEINLGATQRSLPTDPSSIYGQGSIQSKPGLGGAGNFVASLEHE